MRSTGNHARHAGSLVPPFKFTAESRSKHWPSNPKTWSWRFKGRHVPFRSASFATVDAIQFNGQQLPEGAEWDMGGTWVNLPNKKRRYIMPGDWLITSDSRYTQVKENVEF